MSQILLQPKRFECLYLRSIYVQAFFYCSSKMSTFHTIIELNLKGNARFCSTIRLYMNETRKNRRFYFIYLDKLFLCNNWEKRIIKKNVFYMILPFHLTYAIIVTTYCCAKVLIDFLSMIQHQKLHEVNLRSNVL